MHDENFNVHSPQRVFVAILFHISLHSMLPVLVEPA